MTTPASTTIGPAIKLALSTCLAQTNRVCCIAATQSGFCVYALPSAPLGNPAPTLPDPTHSPLFTLRRHPTPAHANIIITNCATGKPTALSSTLILTALPVIEAIA